MFKPEYVIGMDLGTHSSGVCGLPVDPGNDDPGSRRFHFVDQWPGQGVPSMKNLSALLINSDGEVLEWGHAARERALCQPAGSDVHFRAAFKMHLVTPGGGLTHADADRQASEDSQPSEDESSAGRDRADGELAVMPQPVPWIELSALGQAEFLTTALLRKLRESALSLITASGYLEEDTRYCITVPAMFSDPERHRVRRCAIAAGFPPQDGRLVLALEPEAAAHSTLHRKVRVPGGASADPGDLTIPGRQVIILDCGGGTADLAAYEVDAQGQLVEIGLTNGVAAGSNDLNQRFEDRLLADRFGKPEIVAHLKEQAPEAMLLLSERWERGKLSFGPDSIDGVTIPLPTAVDRRLGAPVRKRMARKQRGETEAIVVSVDEMRELFDSVVPDILDAVDAQLTEVEMRCSASGQDPVVVMVGGFSNSPYLQHAVKSHLGTRALVVAPPDPGSAVLYGATHFAYAPQTRARRARLTYGVRVSTVFDPEMDPVEYRYESSEGQVRCTNRFSKLVTRGDSIDTGKEATEWYTPVEGTQEGINVALYSSTETDPRYVTDPGCQLVGRIRVDLSQVMKLALEDRKVDVSLAFGETEIKAQTVVRQSGKLASCSIDFASDY